MLRNKTAIKCWNILKYETESIIDQFVPLKNKENGLERNTFQKKLHCTRKIAYKQTILIEIFLSHSRKIVELEDMR